MNRKLALIKLGGSVITFKEKPLAANFKAIDNISKILAQLEIPSIIVHGGGSFGHYWSVKYNMHTKPHNYNPHGIAVVHESMLTLNQIIVTSMIKNGINPYSIMPSEITCRNKPNYLKLNDLAIIAKNNITPITFGDIIYIKNNKYSIISGDVLMTILANYLRPSKIIFALNVDGIYKDMTNKEIIKQVDRNKRSIKFSKVLLDVTGGMKRKITEAFKISSSGLNVIMLNGLKPERIINAITGSDFEGTIVKGQRRKHYA